MQAGVVSKDTQEGAFLLEAISGLPLVLLSPSESMTECVWRGIEIGAAEVLEKPLSTHKLQNIWQHVVRRVELISNRAQSLCGNCSTEVVRNCCLSNSHSLILILHSNLWMLHCVIKTRSCADGKKFTLLE